MSLKALPLFLWITLLISLLRCCKSLENKGLHCVAFKIGSFQNPYESTAYSYAVRCHTHKNQRTPFAQCSKKFVHK